MPSTLEAQILPPGQVLLDMLKLHDLKQTELAERLGRSPQYITDVIKGKRSFDIELALELETALGFVKAERWMILAVAYQRQQQKVGEKPSRQAVLSTYPLATELIKLKWVEHSRDPREVGVNLQLFWQEAEALGKASGFNRTGKIKDGKSESAEWARLAWGLQVYRQALLQKVPEYRSERHRELVAKLQQLMGLEKGVGQVPELLKEYGIRFVILPHLKLCPVDGVASENDSQPYIGLSLRINRVDSFWFTLMHELAHIEKKHKRMAENIEVKHLEDEAESQANFIARNDLIKDDEYKKFVDRGKYDLTSIKRFAFVLKRHHAIILGRLKNDHHLTWNQFAREHGSVREYLS